MSNGGISEESTLLPSPALDEEGDDTGDIGYSSKDIPIGLDKWKTHVRRWKAILGLGLILSVGLESGHLWALSRRADLLGGDEARWERKMRDWGVWTDVVGVVASAACTILFLVTLIRPIILPRPGYGHMIKNVSLHRTLCHMTFCTFIILPFLHLVPKIAFTLITYQPAPNPHPSLPNLDLYRNLALVLTLIAVGCMRRGPKMRYNPLNLGTSFGINADDKVAPSGGRMVVGRAAAIDDDVSDDGYDGYDGSDGDIQLHKPESEETEQESNVIDYAGSPMFLFILVAYMAPLARKSIRVSQLVLSDLPYIEEWVRNSAYDVTLESVQTVEVASRSGVLRKDKKKITRWKLVKTLWKGRTSAILLTLLVETLVVLLSFLQVLSMHEIIESRDDPSKRSKAYAYLMCWGMFAGQTVECILSAYAWSRENYNLHIPVRLALSSLLFEKILKTTDVKGVDAHTISDEDSKAGKGPVQIINLLTIDVQTIAGLATQVWAITNSAIALSVGTYLLYKMFGVSAFIGILCVPLSGPMSFWVARHIYRADRGWARSRDARTSAIKEFLLCYKVIKLNAFEPYFRLRIERLRAIEVVWQRWRYTLGTLFNILSDQLPTVAISITFIFFTKVFGHNLEPATAFVAFTIFNRVKDAFQRLPKVIEAVFTALVATGRLTEFLNRSEVDISDWENVDNSISFRNATVTWPTAVAGEISSQTFRLKDMSVVLPQGKTTLVCGPLGSGKSLFLRALLGEAYLEQGSIRAPRSIPDETPINGYAIQRLWTISSWLNDSVSYAPQQAYIRHGSIRDNILFGQPMWRSRYEEVLRQASLLPDIALMDDGDLTEVGDQGINLSGGQKARINLARCLYSRSKTVYLDDILSAVDAHTAQFIVNDCLQGELLRDRTVVLVTHHVNLCLPAVNFVISLKEGRIEQACLADEAKVEELEAIDSPPAPSSDLLSRQTNVVESLAKSGKPDKVRAPKPIPRQHYRAEQKSIGSVASSHYMLVLSAAGGLFYWTVFVLIYTGSCSFVIIQPLTLRYWTSHPEPQDLDRNLLIYIAATSIPIFLGAFKWVWLYGWGYRGFYNRGSRVIHATLLDRIMSAPLAFFETTPAGRIMNIFASDMTRLDAQSADSFGRTVTTASAILISSLAVCFQAPPLLVVLIGFAVPMYWLSGALRKLRADLRRLTSIANSPLITLYHDAIQGVVMIRAFGSSRAMQAALHVLINRERTAFSNDNQVYNFLRGTVRAIASVFVTATGFVLVDTDLSGAQVGFILSFAVMTSQGLFGLLETYSELEQTFVSAERINLYVQMEEHESTDGIVPPKEWPSRGAISFNNLSVRYAEDLPEVLHDVSSKIEPGMRVGVVGATGSGKSTLALSLFRAIESHQGYIKIDDLDINDIQLTELRNRLNMVVQDGTLCSGSLREALDITGEKDDHEIYEALRRVHLLSNDVGPEELQSNPFASLDTFVAVEGANFSHGQRQLLCLARALLKNSKILVMDEATSSVDFEMDTKITNTIKECFADTTMIVIAHRLATIMQYDRVLVLAKGEVKEYGSPLDLVQDPSSAFHSLCMAQGQEEYDKLLIMARA